MRRTSLQQKICQSLKVILEGLFIENYARKLMQFAALPSASEIPELVDQLNLAYEASGSSFRVERLATGYQLMTRPIFARWLDKLHERQARLKLSPPAMETLTIVAYRQPLTRADLEEVRGVQSTEILKQLMERGLVKVVGEHDSLGLFLALLTLLLVVTLFFRREP